MKSPPYRPTRWLRSGHTMTIASALLDDWREPALPPSQPRFFDTAPGTRVLGHWHAPSAPDGPTAVLLHGLTGHASAGYMRGTAAELSARGFGVLRLNSRNCGGTEGLTDTLYHAGLSVDVKAVLHQLANEGHPRLFVAGFSMGGNIALKAVGELGPEAPDALYAVAAVSPPIRLGAASASIERGWVNAIYQRHFLDGLRGLYRRKATAHPGRFSTEGLDTVRSLRAFDDRFVAPNFDFAGADDYYARASAEPWLGRITCPTLVIQARDDSIVPEAPLEAWMARRPRNVTFELFESGGHVGFLQRRGASTRFWAEARIAEFAAEHAARA